MNSDNGKIWVGFEVDTSGLKQGEQEAGKTFDNIGASAEKASSRIDEGFSNSAKSASKSWEGTALDIKESISIQKEAIKELERKYKEAEKAVKGTAPGITQSNLIKELQQAKKEIDAEKEALRMLTAEQDKTSASATTLLTQQKKLRLELAGMKEGTEEYAKKMRELGVIRDRMGDVNRQGQIFADDNKNIRATTEAIGGLTAVMQTGAGIMAIFGVNSENAQKITAKLMAITMVANGVNQIANVINKDSYVSHVLVAGAKNMVTVATTRLATALGITNIAAKALMATLTLGLSIAITAVIVAISKWSDEKEKFKKEQEELLAKTKKFNTEIADGAIKQISIYERLRNSYIALGKDAKKQEQFILDNKKAFSELGVSVDNVADAQNIFVNNAEAFTKSLIYQAEAAAYASLAVEDFKKAIEAELSVRETKAPEKPKLDIGGVDKQAYDQQSNLYNFAKGLGKQAVEDSKKAGEEKLKKEAELLQLSADLRKSAGIEGLKSQGELKNKESQALKDYEKLKLSQNEKLAKSEIELERSRIREAEKLREFDFNQKLAQIKEEQELYENLSKLAGKPADTKVFQERIDIETKLFQESEAEIKQKENEAILKQYATFSEKYLAKIKELADAKKAIEEAGGTDEQKAVAQQKYDEELRLLDEQFFKGSEGFESFADEIVELSVEKLNLLVTELEAQLAESSEGIESESNAVLRAKIEALKAQLKGAKTESEKQGEGDIKRWQGTQKVLNDIISTTTSVIDGFEGISDEAKNIIKTVLLISSTTVSVIDSIKTYQQAVSVAMTASAKGAAASVSAVEKASVILAVISAVIQVATAIASLFSGNAKAEEDSRKRLQEISESRNELQQKYNNLLFEQNLLMKEASNIFGTDYMAKALRAYQLYVEGVENLRSRIKGVASEEMKEPKNLADYLKAIKQAKEGTGLDSIKVVTGSKTESSGFLGLGKKQVDVYSSISKAYPEITKGANGFNVELAKQILATQKLSNEDKLRLQQLIDIAENYEKARDALKDYLKATFGSLGDSLMESITNAIENGTDAFKEFGKSAGEVIKNLGKQLAFQLFFKKELDKLEADLEKTYEIGETPEEIAELQAKAVTDFYNGIGQNMDKAQQFQEDWNKKYEDTFGKGSLQQGTASAGTIQNISPEQANRIDGKLTAIEEGQNKSLDNQIVIKESVLSMTGNVSFIREGVDELKGLTRRMSEDVAKIKVYSSELPEIAKTLKNVEFNTNKL